MIGAIIILALPFVLFAMLLVALLLRSKRQLDDIAAHPVTDERFHRLWRERLSWDGVLALVTGMMGVFNLMGDFEYGVMTGLSAALLWFTLSGLKAFEVWRQTRLGWPDAADTKHARRLLLGNAVFAPGAVFGENGAVRTR